jgi:hypothetical protein
MSSLAPQWLFGAQAIDSDGNPHLSKGVHLRLFFSQQLGLPAFPFQVYRLDLGPGAKAFAQRTDITWIDSHGVTLTTPFNVTPDNPVTGWLPGPNVANCCWIDVLAVPTVGPLPFPVHPVLPVLAPAVPSLPAAPEPAPAIHVPGPVSFPLPPHLVWRPGLRAHAVITTPRGPGIVATRTAQPYQLAASRIDRVVISGRGAVRGVRWLAAEDVAKVRELWRTLALPIPQGQRYTGIPNAEDEAKQRVIRGAPPRESLMDVPDVPNPASAPLIASPDAEEWGRVDTRRPELMSYLDRLLNDLGAPAADLVDPRDVFNENGVQVGHFDVNLLGTVMNGSVDPGFARLLGFAEVDETVAAAPGQVICYVIRGWWDRDASRVSPQVQALLPPAAYLDADKGPDTPPKSVKKGYLDLLAVACATIGAPPAVPGPPALGAPVAGPWMPTHPKEEREIQIPASGLMPAASAAFARSNGPSFDALNEKGPDGRRLPISPSVPPKATDPSQGIFYDRHAPPPAVQYRVAQTDWFGRWSTWSQVNAPAGVRPAPPRPDPTVFYTPPAFGTPVPGGALAGTVRVKVPVPLPEAMAPGSLPLASLQVTLNGSTSVNALTAAPGTGFELTFAGPALARCATGVLTVTTWWVNTAGVQSQPSQTISRAIADPRPPVQVVIPNTLNYGSRPDVTGKSRIDLRWTASSTQKRFRVFYTDETTLRTRLERMVARNEAGQARAQSILAAAAATTSPQDRAAVYVANKDFFTRDMFELLTHDPLPAPGFVHQVSGSLRVLVFYRIVAVSDGNVEVTFIDTEMVPFGIPNSGTPAIPVLEVKPGAGNTAVIRIKVPLGAVAAVEYRLRRTLSKSSDILSMPVVGSGMVPAATLTPPPPGAITDTVQVVDVTDTGASELAPAGTLRQWTTYTWRAEVRGGTEPGSSVTGEWSLPSAPVSMALFPDTPPPRRRGSRSRWRGPTWRSSANTRIPCWAGAWEPTTSISTSKSRASRRPSSPAWWAIHAQRMASSTFECQGRSYPARRFG